MSSEPQQGWHNGTVWHYVSHQEYEQLLISDTVPGRLQDVDWRVGDHFIVLPEGMIEMPPSGISYYKAKGLIGVYTG